MNDLRLAAILTGLQTAMRAEFEGYHFYMLAAQNTDDAKGQDVFRQLANDEFEHMNFLQAQFDNMAKKQQPNGAIMLKKIRPFTGENPIFSEKIKARIKDAHYEMTVLSVGIQLELNAAQSYKKLAAESNEEVVARFYRELAEWENSHYRMLVAQQEELRVSYWDANNFQPF